MEIELYNYVGEQNRVTKILENPVIVEGTMNTPDNSILTPTIIFKNDIEDEDTGTLTFNYAYIPKLRRYYYIDDITIIANNLCSLRLRVDVLKTYATAILSAQGRITHSEKPNQYQMDADVLDTITTKVMEFPKDFSNIQPTNVMVTVTSHREVTNE